MANIHPTALVSPHAMLEEDVIVGPGAIVEAGAVIGSGCRLLARSIVMGSVRMGKNNEVGVGAVLGADPQVLGKFSSETKSYLEIGNENIFREYVTLHRASKEGAATKIGDHNFLMVGV